MFSILAIYANYLLATYSFFNYVPVNYMLINYVLVNFMLTKYIPVRANYINRRQHTLVEYCQITVLVVSM